MLGRLFRYDFKNIGKQAFALYVVMIVFLILRLITEAIQSRCTQNIVVDFLSTASKGTFYAGLALLFVMVVVISISYYRKNLFQDEGYLMNTLPVTPGNLIGSKLLATIAWCMITLLTCYVFQAVVSTDLLWGRNLFHELMEGKEIRVFVLAVTLYTVLWFISILCGAYMAFCVGYSFSGKSQYIRNACIAAIFILVYIINQMVMVVMELMQFGSFDMENQAVEELIGTLLAKCFFCGAFVQLILAGIYFSVAVVRMNRHLNLD